jgi:uncharacterized membrane protein
LNRPPFEVEPPVMKGAAYIEPVKPPLPKDVALLAGLFTVSGVVHLVKPAVYRPLMPSWVPAHDQVILGSGLAELVCAAGLLHPAYRRPAGWASAALLLAVFPGNLKMAVDSTRTRSTRFKAIAFARLPLQAPMIRSALKAARS